MPDNPKKMSATPAIEELIAIMAQLRSPEGGCPWDVEQDFDSIAPYTIEEAYEVAEAIREGDMEGLKGELGDLLFQVVFHAQMAAEEGLFDFADVVAAVSDKMVARHPHVFGDHEIADAEAQTEAWEDYKAEERRQKAREDAENGGEAEFGDDEAAAGARESVLDNVPLLLPALLRALKLQKRAARVGFDWPEIAPVFAKIAEELHEVTEALDEAGEPRADTPTSPLAHEIGDLLFAVVNLARHVRVEPENALRLANSRFEARFRLVEAALAAEGRHPADATLEELDKLWDNAKAALQREADDVGVDAADEAADETTAKE